MAENQEEMRELDTESLDSLRAPVVVEDPSFLRIAVIAEAEVTLGFLLAGIGYHSDKFRNYMNVDSETPQEELERFFNAVYHKSNMGLIILDYDAAKRLRSVMANCTQLLPVVMTVPNKDSLMAYLDSKERKRRIRARESY
ncbi:probable V-type proton ATPase subunit F [Drosophila kikkawai]|uniref:Probable V-type proton ATPase subunit F n=1 Tax=Drosophila kikkawai TaxID=30033 RepID=A0A6P4IGV6_DROKI|nr:uncharacterized protein LOC108075103 [Drosophila kikkawai]